MLKTLFFTLLFLSQSLFAATTFRCVESNRLGVYEVYLAVSADKLEVTSSSGQGEALQRDQSFNLSPGGKRFHRYQLESLTALLPSTMARGEDAQGLMIISNSKERTELDCLKL